jgi:hypothetical protein
MKFGLIHLHISGTHFLYILKKAGSLSTAVAKNKSAFLNFPVNFYHTRTAVNRVPVPTKVPVPSTNSLT